MATVTIYNNALLEMAKGTLVIPANATHKVLLLGTSSTYAADKTDVYVSEVFSAGGSEVVSGGGYSTGGNIIANVTATTSSNTVELTFSDVSWTSSTIAANGAIIYKPGSSGYSDAKLIAHIGFGTTISSSNSTLTIDFTAALRLAN